MMSELWENFLDATLVPLSLFLLLAYHGYLYYKVKVDPQATTIGINHKARRAWVKSIMEDNPGRTVLAVQTLRNSIMGSTLMATSAILLASGLAAIISSTYKIKDPLRHVVFGHQNEITVTAKFITLCFCFIFSFLCYTQSIRFTNHVNYLINIPLAEAETTGVTHDYVADVLARASNFYTVGTRSFYLAFSLLLWLFGPLPVLVASCFLMPFLYHLDFVKKDCRPQVRNTELFTVVKEPEYQI